LDTVTFIDSAVVKFSPELVWVKIHAEQDSVTAEKYHVRNFPTVLLTNPDGSEIDRIVGFLPPDEFLTEIKNYMAGVGTLDDLVKKVAEEPNGEMAMKIGDKYSYRGKSEKAIEYYNMVIELDPDNKDSLTDNAMLSIGGVYADQKEYDKAIDQYKLVMKKFAGDSAEADAMFSIGSTYLRMKDYDKAVGQFDTIAKKYKETENEADAMLWKGYVLRKKPDTASAIKVYEDFLQKFPESSDTTHAMSQLEKLKNPPPPEEEGH
jgi:tetratricopeptide (TPR) repeat protein